jgi:DNA polymerase phi
MARPTLEVPGHVLQHFWDLANIEAEVRRNSAVSLVKELKASQDAHGDDDGNGDGGGGAGGAADEAPDEHGRESFKMAGCSPVVVYALKRLARGLGSGRSGARQGFALALTAAFSEIPSLPFPDGLKLLKSSIEPITQSTKAGSCTSSILTLTCAGCVLDTQAVPSRRLKDAQIQCQATTHEPNTNTLMMPK